MVGDGTFSVRIAQLEHRNVGRWNIFGKNCAVIAQKWWVMEYFR
jgi:hypothetical protein